MAARRQEIGDGVEDQAQAAVTAPAQTQALVVSSLQQPQELLLAPSGRTMPLAQPVDGITAEWTQMGWRYATVCARVDDSGAGIFGDMQSAVRALTAPGGRRLSWTSVPQPQHVPETAHVRLGILSADDHSQRGLPAAVDMQAHADRQLDTHTAAETVQEPAGVPSSADEDLMELEPSEGDADERFCAPAPLRPSVQAAQVAMPSTMTTAGQGREGAFQAGGASAFSRYVGHTEPLPLHSPVADESAGGGTARTNFGEHCSAIFRHLQSHRHPRT
ncbi:hypothetical protein WJX73_010482 [Symbiochloris irregularis]|uniref:Uncharacterized protein n=1 Tax=Symbiochloris irregularis TaxID=706552 RepID=A0AAW1NMU6_9CHLO